MARRGIYTQVTVALHAEDLVCRRHRRWLGDGSRSGQDDQPLLTDQPEILAANRLHRALIRRNGRRAVRDAAFAAGEICTAWRRRLDHDDSIQQLMRRFHGDNWHVLNTDPTLEAASYPQLIALTRLLVSPVWRAMPFDPNRSVAFLAEVRRTVAPRYRWHTDRAYGHFEPLAELYLTETQARRTGDPPRSPIFATPERPMNPWPSGPDWELIPARPAPNSDEAGDTSHRVADNTRISRLTSALPWPHLDTSAA